MIRRSLTLLGAALAVFHVWLFAGQLWSGALSDPTLIAEWVLAFGLAGALAVLKRQGECLLFGRKAVAIWVTAALLHGPALISRAESGDVQIPEVVVTLTQAVVGLAGLAALAIFFAGVRVRRPASPTRGRAALGLHVPALITSAGLAFSPRPPPLTH